MGTCVINLRVIGCHHTGSGNDIDAIARRFVAKLKAEGHSVQFASLVVPNTEDDINTAPSAQSEAHAIAPGAQASGTHNSQ